MINVEDLGGPSELNRSNPYLDMVVQSIGDNGDQQSADRRVLVIDFQEVPIYFM